MRRNLSAILFFWERIAIFVLYLAEVSTLSGGVIGNTSGFGSEESRFEPWPDNAYNAALE